MFGKHESCTPSPRLIEIATGVATLLAIVSAASADDGSAPDIVEPQSHLLSAHPDAYGVTFLWRGQLRGTLSARVPIMGGQQTPGFEMSITPLIELHNSDGSGQLLPNENWRGKLGIKAGWVWGNAPTARRFYLGGAARHESDHATDREDAPGVALQLNEITLLGGIQLPQPRLMVRVDVQARALIISCTDIFAQCGDFNGPSSFGTDVDLVLDAGGAEPLRKRWYFYSAVHTGAIVPNGDVIRELRAALHVGVWVRPKLGVWQLFALGFFGNDIGITRADTVYQAGAGARWMY